MPPFGRDDQIQAVHVLNVVDCAKALVAVISQSGGVSELGALMSEPMLAAFKRLFDETSKLQIYETRAAARGTSAALTDERLATAIKDVRERRVLSAGERDVLDATQADVTATFSLDEDAAEAPCERADDDRCLGSDPGGEGSGTP